MGPVHPGRSILDTLYNKEGDLNRAAFFVYATYIRTCQDPLPFH